MQMVGRTNPIEFPELILRRLALNPELTTNPSSIKGLTRYQISRGFEQNDKRIPQSSILAYTKILNDKGWIKSISTIKIATRKYKITYDLTILGLIEWLHYLYKNWNFDPVRVRIVIGRSQRFLSFISNNWMKLKEIFKDEDVMILILLASSDMEINNSSDSKSIDFFASAPISVSGLKIQVTNKIEIPIPKRLKTKMVLEVMEQNLEELFTFVYLYRLETKTQDRNSDPQNRGRIISLIKSDPSTYASYLKFIEQLKTQLVKAVERIDYIEKTMKDSN